MQVWKDTPEQKSNAIQYEEQIVGDSKRIKRSGSSRELINVLSKDE